MSYGLNSGLGNQIVSLIEKILLGDDEQETADDTEAVTEELRDVMAERDDLRRQLASAREAFEQLRRALYPGLF